MNSFEANRGAGNSGVERNKDVIPETRECLTKTNTLGGFQRDAARRESSHVPMRDKQMRRGELGTNAASARACPRALSVPGSLALSRVISQKIGLFVYPQCPCHRVRPSQECSCVAQEFSPRFG